MTKGAFQVSREIFENEIWSDVLKFRIFFYILGKAVFSQEGVDHAGMHLERGQYLRSLRNLQNDLAYKEGRGNAVKKPPLETLRRKIKSLEKEGRITTKSTEYGTLFTVVNYAKYQGFDYYKKQSMGQQWDSDESAMGQQRDNNKNVNKDNNVVVEEDALVFFDKNIARISEHVKGELIAWIDDFKSEEIVLAALKLAAESNATSYAYVKKILIEWHKHNLRDIEQVRNHEIRKRAEKKVTPFRQKKQEAPDDGYNYGF